MIFWVYLRQRFKSNTIYRINYVLGIINTCLQLYIMCSIWKLLYATYSNFNGISYSMIVTNYVIAIGLSNAFLFDDFAVQKKISDGSIALEFIKPIDYRISLLAGDLGNIFFYLGTKFCPVLLWGFLSRNIEAPKSVLSFFFFLVSIILGFLVLWGINLVVQMSTFWFVNIWSISVLKDLIISIFSGVSLPLWFIPEKWLDCIEYSPFVSIYFEPIKIYLGQMGKKEILYSYGKQIIWIILFFLVSDVMWYLGQKRLVIQGG